MSLLIKAGITKLSELEIDAAKDWAAKKIENLGAPDSGDDATTAEDRKLVLPAIRKLSLTDLGIKFSASDIDVAITGFEDCAVIKAHDGDYYLFLDDDTVTNHDVWCVKSSTPTFDSYTVIGKVITRADTRVMGVVYDEENEEYILYLENEDTYDTNAYYIAKADFPDGVWTDAGIVLVKGAAGSYDAEAAGVLSILKIAGLYIMGYVAKTGPESYWALAYSLNPRGTFTKHPSNPIYSREDKNIKPAWVTGVLAPRATLPLANGYLSFFEGWTATGWKVGVLFLDSSLTHVYEIQGSPFTAVGFANANSIIVESSSKKAYLYFQEHDVTWKHQHVAEIDLKDLAIWGEIV